MDVAPILGHDLYQYTATRRRFDMKKKLMILLAMMAIGLIAAAPAIAEVSFEIGDQEVESGDFESETSFSIEGNNNNQCVGALQFGNTGNFTNQQGALQYASEVDDLEFTAQETVFEPSNETACEQEVQQAAAASSG
jgi:hypothetical protein